MSLLVKILEKTKKNKENENFNYYFNQCIYYF